MANCGRLWFSTIFPLAVANAGCSRPARDSSPSVVIGSSAAPAEDSRIHAPNSPAALAVIAIERDAAAPVAKNSPTVVEERILHFAWKPSSGNASEYAMSEAEDQHRIWLLRGVQSGHTYPVVVAFHGQPRRGQLPRNYVFPETVARVARTLVTSGEVAPFVLVTPVFRFEGKNWPDFDPVDFVRSLKLTLMQEGITAGNLYFIGHSGAAGCGGGGLNGIADADPSAVGFFDTCIGAGFVNSVRNLSKRRVPTLIVHSVETAGFQPREPIEYEAQFDFGKIYSKVGLLPGSCPEHLPEVPLRKLAYRCAANEGSTTRALVIDTGEGEKAHEALVPVAFRYFLGEYVGTSK